MYEAPARVGVTRLKEIRISVGKTGVLTPVGILEPVSVGGVVIKKATLHNEDYIRRNGIEEGGLIIVYRAGDVIPKVAGCLES